MNASRIARTVTRDFDLWPPLTAADVRAVAGACAATPLGQYGEGQQSAIESRILQEADRG